MVYDARDGTVLMFGGFSDGYSFDDVVRATVFLTDIEDYHEMNKEYASYFKSAFPARACVGGVELVFGFRVEISCIAYKAGAHRGD